MKDGSSTLSVVVNAQADARPMYKQRPWQAVTNRCLKTVSLVVRALQPVSRIFSPATTTPSRLRTVIPVVDIHCCVVFGGGSFSLDGLSPPFLQQSAIPMTLCCKHRDTRQGRHPHCFQFAHFGGHFFKVKIMKSTALYAQKQTPAEEVRRENLYHAKLQCLAEVLGKQSRVDEGDAKRSAEAINAAFDKITF